MPGARWRAAALASALAAGGCEGWGPRTHAVSIRAFQYAPAELRVAAGDTVVWTNEDLVPHTATAAGWGTGGIAPRESRRVVIGTPGTHTYLCDFHPGMKARVEAE
jgi:plastocyanin